MLSTPRPWFAVVSVALTALVGSCSFDDGDGFFPIDDALPVERIDFVGTLESIDVQGSGLPRSLPTAGNHLGGPNGPTTIGPGQIVLADVRSFSIISATAGTDCASVSISTPAMCSVVGQLSNQNVEWIMLVPDIRLNVEIDGEMVSLLLFGGNLVDIKDGQAFVDAREATLAAEIDPSAILVDCRTSGSLNSRGDMPDAVSYTAWIAPATATVQAVSCAYGD